MDKHFGVIKKHHFLHLLLNTFLNVVALCSPLLQILSSARKSAASALHAVSHSSSIYSAILCLLEVAQARLHSCVINP